MSLQSLISAVGENVSVVEDSNVILESVSEDAIAAIITVALESTCSEEELDELEEECSTSDEPVTENLAFAPVLERSIVKLDKNAQKQKAYKMAVLQVAKEMDLKEYKQWCTIKKMERVLMNRMEKRCHTKAKAYMREAAKRSKESTKNPIKRVASALSRSMQRTQKALKGDNNIPSDLKSKTSAIVNKLGNK